MSLALLSTLKAIDEARARRRRQQTDVVDIAPMNQQRGSDEYTS